MGRVLFEEQGWRVSLGAGNWRGPVVEHSECPAEERNRLGDQVSDNGGRVTFEPDLHSYACYSCREPIPSFIMNMWHFTKWCSPK